MLEVWENCTHSPSLFASVVMLYIYKIDVAGNGDILSYYDYNRCMEQSGVAGCMIAR
jgi:tRNA-dihydrouridine synthase